MTQNNQNKLNKENNKPDLKHNHSGSDSVRIRMQDLTGVISACDWIDASEFGKNPAKSPTIVKHGSGVALEFADGQELEALFNFKIPCGAKIGEDIDILIGWSSPAVSKVADLEFTYSVTALGEDTSVAGTQIQQYATSSSVANGLSIAIFVIPASVWDKDDVCFHCSIQRDGNDANDTLSDVFNLLGVCIQYKRDKIGKKI